MPLIIWRDCAGAQTSADVPLGTSLMEAALAAGVRGIHGDCGGALACATCHVVPEAPWAERLGPPGALEADMLDLVEGERHPTSRLSCQIRMRETLAGLVLRVPQP
ncbi:2Fe-2S iron-sulfur cluster-binding protein [Ancylobacter terrae]|uniref:2Fe-2S iron-sulfur cluster-binding protein n=1 Tax=Ancylobacter sp. sgz301288 TaxID=3342077 RepID=UPI00385EFABA